MPDRKKLITEDMEPDFLLLFDRLIPDVDMVSLTPHEIFEGLASQQIRMWRGFIMMQERNHSGHDETTSARASFNLKQFHTDTNELETMDEGEI